VTETPETPTPSLAERLEQIAAYLEHHEDDAADLRAAAAQLRQLDRIKAAVLDDEWALRDLLVTALNDAWGDYTGDTHCYPEVLTVTRGPFVEADFAKGNFTLMAAGWLQRRLRDALEADDGA
jgi:hypothetical protein